MALQIIDGGDLKATTIVAVIYGSPSIGKTTLAFTASKPILFDFDGNAFKASNRAGKKVVGVESWQDLKSMNRQDIESYDTLIVDTVGTCLDKLAVDIMAGDARKGSGGTLNVQGYGALKTRFKTWLDMVRSFGKDVVLIAHGEEDQRGDETMDRIVATGSSKQTIYQQATIMGRYYVGGDGRTLTFEPTPTSFGKNVGLEDYIIRAPSLQPHLMAEILREAKRLINDHADDDDAEHRRLAQLREHITGIDDIAEFQRLLGKMIEHDAGPIDRKILVEVGESKGFEIDRAAKAFKAPTDEEEAVSPEAPF